MEARGILSFLNVRDNESKLVVDLSLHYFAQSVGIAIFFTVCSTQFLCNYDISFLPYLFVISGVFQLITGRIYNYFEHHINLNKMMPRVVILLGLLSLVAFASSAFFEFEYSYFIAYLLFYVIYLLNSLEFWGVSAISFDVRQSKRLFGIISMGDIPAKLLGYMIVPLFVAVFPIDYLYFIAFVAFFASFFSLKKLLKHNDLHIEHEHKKDTPRILAQKKFTKKYIIQIGILSGSAVFAITFINFSFLSEVQRSYATETELAMFLGTFFSFGKAITIVYKIFFAGRLTEKFGIRKNLLIFPLALLSVCLIITFFYFFFPENIYILYLIGVLMLIVEVVKKAIHEPVFLALFQPLNRHDRLHGHAVVKGVTDPIFLIMSSFLLIWLMKSNAHVDLIFVNYVLLATLLVWLLIVIVVNRSYFNNLLSAFDKRIGGLQHLNFESHVLKQQVQERIKSENIDEIAFIYSLLSKEAQFPTLAKLLATGKSSLVIFALSEYTKLTDRERIPLGEIESYISCENEDIRKYAFEVFATNCESPEFLLPQLEKSSIVIKSAIITGLLKRNSIEHITTGGEFLFKMLNDDSTKKEALQIVGNIGNNSFYRPIIKAFTDTNDEVIKTAIHVASKINNHKLIPHLIHFLHDKKHGRAAVSSLAMYKNDAVEQVAPLITEYSLSENTIRRCISLCGRIETRESKQVLLKIMNIPSQALYMQMLDSLTRINYKVSQDHRELIISKINNEINFMLYIIQSMFVLNDSKIFKNTVHALNLELTLIQSRIFSLLTFIYPKYPILRSREGLFINNSDIQSNALETLEMTLKDLDIKMDIIAVMDPHLPLGEKQKRLEKRSHQVRIADETVTNKVLYSRNQEFNKWTIASVLYDLKLNNREIDHQQKVHQAHHSLIQQIVLPMENEGHLINFDKILLLRTTDIFSETPENILVDLADIMEEVEVKAGEVIFEKGTAGYDMYIIHKGTVDIKDKETILSTLKDKNFFGELSLLDAEPRSATALAKTDCVLFRIDQEAFYEIMSDRVEVAKGIMKVLCRRLRRQNEKVVVN